MIKSPSRDDLKNLSVGDPVFVSADSFVVDFAIFLRISKHEKIVVADSLFQQEDGELFYNIAEYNLDQVFIFEEGRDELQQAAASLSVNANNIRVDAIGAHTNGIFK